MSPLVKVVSQGNITLSANQQGGNLSYPCPTDSTAISKLSSKLSTYPLKDLGHTHTNTHALLRSNLITPFYELYF